MCCSLGIAPNSQRAKGAFLLGFIELFGILWDKIVSADTLAYNSLFSLGGAKVY